MFSSPWKQILSAIRESRDAVLTRLADMEKRIMSGVADLQNAITTLQSDVTAEDSVIAQVITALQAGGLTDAQAEALA